MQEKIKELFTENIQMQIAGAEMMPAIIANAAERLVATLLRGNKIIVCGSERSYAIAQIFVTNLLNRYHLMRPSFPCGGR